MSEVTIEKAQIKKMMKLLEEFDIDADEIRIHQMCETLCEEAFQIAENARDIMMSARMIIAAVKFKIGEEDA